MQIWRKAGSYNADKAAPSSWIFTIARNLRIDRLRKQKFHEVEISEQVIETSSELRLSDRAADHTDAGRLASLVGELPPEQTDVVRLSFFEGMSHAEIGQRLELPLGTVKSRMRLAFAKLRTSMGEQL